MTVDLIFMSFIWVSLALAVLMGILGLVLIPRVPEPKNKLLLTLMVGEMIHYLIYGALVVFDTTTRAYNFSSYFQEWLVDPPTPLERSLDLFFTAVLPGLLSVASILIVMVVSFGLILTRQRLSGGLLFVAGILVIWTLAGGLIIIGTAIYVLRNHEMFQEPSKGDE